MTAFWIALLFLTQGTLLLCAIGHLGRKVKRLDKGLRVLDLTVRAQDLALSGRSAENIQLKAQALTGLVADVERLAASHESACELNSAGLEAQTSLSILHAETVTRLQSRVDKLAHDPHYQRPVRKDN